MNKLLLLPLTTVLLASCSGGTTTPPTNTTPPTIVTPPITAPKAVTSLSGKVTENGSAWAGGEGTVTLSAPKGYLSTTTLKADGTFSFATLPTPTANDLILYTSLKETSDNCTEKESLSDTSLRVTIVNFFLEAQSSGLIRLFASDSEAKTNVEGVLFYADRDSKITNTQTCIFNSQTFVNTLDIQLVKGWNQLVNIVPQDMTTPTVNTTVQNGTVTNGKWVYEPNATSKSLKSLSDTHLLR
ncbi:hypothetical protein [Deinococcus sp.]|uniref:hypothetical protein n=1 Tax=Deinococcus sp. TaxID=47478 RepID=UPI003B590DD6